MSTEAQPLVSIVVPVYNVEKYLPRCLDSIVGQTYKTLEIIVVDDGATDNCGAICDTYAAKDKRVKVIHKANGGLSSARNKGMEIATGEYLLFVDSDDRVHEREVELSLKCALEKNADIVFFGHCDDYDGRLEREQIPGPQYDNIDFIKKAMLWDDIGSYAWNKLFKRSLWDGIIFPLNANWEDLAVMLKVFMRTQSYARVPEILYYYNCANGGSISSTIKSRNKMGMYLGWRLRYEIGTQLQDKELIRHARMRSVRSAVTCLGLNTQDHLLNEAQVAELKAYVQQENAKGGLDYIGAKYRLLVWGTLHCENVLAFYGSVMYKLQKLKKH